MNKVVYLFSGLMSFMIAGNVLAQLPANPWDAQNIQNVVNATSSADGGVAKISASNTSEKYIPSVKYAPVNADAEAPAYVPAIDSQGNAKTGVQVKTIASESDSVGSSQTNAGNTTASTKAGTTVAQQQDIQNNNTSWRGSGQFGKLDYTGEVTTYGTAYGQEMLAPEVNQHNIKVMLDHLRKLGYKIPESYDNQYSNFLAEYKTELQEAYNGLGHQNNPFDTMFSGILDVVEGGTGLDIENLLFNSINLLSQE